MKKLEFSAILLALFLSTVVILQAQEVIEVSIQGISDGIKNSKRIDRDEAIMDAKLQAVEKAGVNIKSVAKVENFMLKKDWIQSKAEAYLMPGFKIVDVGYGTDGLYHVVLIGKVRTAAAKPSFKTVKIGDQVWSAENLDVDHYRNGDPIPQVQDETKWCNINYGAWCYYENDTEYGRIYGKLYNWYAVNDPRGLAPPGWHVPSDSEWQILVDFLGGSDTASKKLKSSSGWKDNGNGSNSSGFSALPAGFRSNGNGTFYYLDLSANFWSSTETHSNHAWYRYLYYKHSGVGLSHYHKRNGFSVRLIRD